MNDYTESWDAILAALRNTADEELACNQIPDELFAAYAEKLRLQEEIAEDDLLPVQTHLQHCPDCDRLLTALLETLEWGEDMFSLATSARRPFALDFLSYGTEAPAMPERVRQAFAQGYGWVRDLQGALWIDLSATPGPGSTPDYLPVTKRSPGVPSRAGGPQEGEILYHFAIGTDELDDLDVEVAGMRQGKTELCTIAVKASVPSRWPQIGGVEVEVVIGSEVRCSETGLDDRAVFENIPLPHLSHTYVRLLTG
jgi:hypothetical protein